MALVLKDRVKETTTTTGTGSFSLAGAVTGYDSFGQIGTGNTTYYAVYLDGGSEWEVGIGTYTAPSTLSRDTILASSNAGSVVTFSAGQKTIWCDYPAGTSVYASNNGSQTSGQVLKSNGVGTPPTWQTTTNGDVVGPASATDNAIARYDSTTGKLIQNSTVTINDNGTLEAVNGISFDTTPTSAPTAEGSLSWNSSDNTLDLVMKGGNVVQQIGEKQYYTVRNETGSTIANGTPVMANGVTSGSGRITVTPAIANGSIDELRFIGLTTESITSGINGYVTSFGYVRGLDTRGTPYGETWAEGDIIYVSPTTAGYLTNVEPTAPNLKIVVAIVITRNQTSGVLLVRPTAYPHITDLSDVNISSPTSGNLLIYDAPQNRWENADLTASTGISVTNGAGSVTITNTAPDQVVSLTGAGTTSISGTYPNFTITSNDQYTGTVTSVSGSAPIASSGGNTPTISITQATTSTDGYLSSTDWNTFNNKGSGTVTAVSVTSANGFAGTSSGGATPALTLSTSVTGVLKGNGTAISAASAGTDYVAPATATSFTALQTFSGSTSVAALKTTNIKEVITVSATAATGTINYDITTQSVLYYTSNASGNWTVNFRGSSGTSLDTLMSTGESMSVTFMVTQGATPYYNSAVQVDGSSVTPKWQGGVAPTAGNANAIDVYTYVIVKTGSATFTVFASQTQFK